MENPTPVGKDMEVAVAIKKGSVSQVALKWTIDHLLTEGHSVTLVHVRPDVPLFNKKLERHTYRIEAYSGTDVSKAIESGFKDILDVRAREMLLPFESYCKRKKLQFETVILVDDDVVNALSDFVLVKNIDVLVMGITGLRKGVVRKLMGPDVTSRVSKRIPYFCTLYAVAKGKLQFVKYSTSISQSIPEKDVDFADDKDNASSLTYCESSVSENSRTGLLQSDTGKELEFRYPLKDYGRSDFSIGGFTSSDSDTSFVNSDSHVSDGTSYSWSTYSSGWSSNSSGSHASLPTNNSDWNNWSSGSSLSLLPEHPGMDEIERLRMELINSKTKYTSCNEADDELILASKLNLLDLNEDQVMNRMRKPQKSLSRVEGRRFVFPASTIDINQTDTAEALNLQATNSQANNLESSM